MAAAEVRDSFPEFEIYTDTYSTRETVPIHVHVLISKTLPAGVHPLFINFHGGCLVTGSALLPDLFPPLVRRAIRTYSAISITADYTLLPHPKGLKAIHEDLSALNKWLYGRLSALLQTKTPGYYADVDRVLVHGSSAGGYLALAYALAYPTAVQALSLVYPMIDFDTRWWIHGSKREEMPNPMMVPDAEMGNEAGMRSKVAALRDGKPCTAAGDERDLGIAFAYWGLFRELLSPAGQLDDDETVWLNRRIAAGAALPDRIWVMHGDADSLVPAETSRSFARIMEQQERAIRLDLVKGKEHGFDANPGDDFDGEEDPLIVDAQSWLAQAWLNKVGRI